MLWGWTDMRLPLLYAISWPDRVYTDWEPLDLVKAGTLTFREPDHAKYPCMAIAYAAGRAGGTMTAVLNAANEQAVALFLEEQIRFLDIPKVIERVCDRHRDELIEQPTLDDILTVDRWARSEILTTSKTLTETAIVSMG